MTTTPHGSSGMAPPPPDAPVLVGNSPALTTLRSKLPSIADAQRTTLIGGPTGCGKDLVARALHWHSSRRDRSYVVVHCAALPESLAEAEMFGYCRGAFTGALQPRQGLIRSAGNGTIFLDEIDSLPSTVQAKLLRFLETGELRAVGSDHTERSEAWILAATNQDLNERVRNGAFRADLMYRLAVVKVDVPPLNQRRDDILCLANHFLAGVVGGRKSLSDGAKAALLAYTWPGNVRELRNRIETAALFSGAGQIEADDLGLPGSPDAAFLVPIEEPYTAESLEQALWSLVNQGGLSLSQAMARCERLLIHAALDAEGNNRTRAAARLGIHVRTIFKKLTP